MPETPRRPAGAPHLCGRGAARAGRIGQRDRCQRRPLRLKASDAALDGSDNARSFALCLPWRAPLLIPFSAEFVPTCRKASPMAEPFQLPLFPDQAVLTRIRPERNEWRFYRLAVWPDLFGRALLARHWGRIGTQATSALTRTRTPAPPSTPSPGSPAASAAAATRTARMTRRPARAAQAAKNGPGSTATTPPRQARAPALALPQGRAGPGPGNGKPPPRPRRRPAALHRQTAPGNTSPPASATPSCGRPSAPIARCAPFA